MKTAKRLAPWAAGLLALALFILLLVKFTGDGGDSTPEVRLPLPVESGRPSGDDPEAGSSLTIADVTPETVLDVLATLSRADSYARELTVETFWDGGSGTEEISVWARGNSLRLVSGEKNLLLTEDKLWIWYTGGNKVLYGEAEAQADRYQRILTYEDLLTGSYEITDAGYTQLRDEPCIFVEYVSGAFGYRDRLFISVANGLLIGAETLGGDKVIYRMSSGPVDISTPSDEIFAPPEGQYVSTAAPGASTAETSRPS